MFKRVTFFSLQMLIKVNQYLEIIGGFNKFFLVSTIAFALLQVTRSNISIVVTINLILIIILMFMVKFK